MARLMAAPQPLLEAPFADLPAADDLVRAAVEWHFDPATGSPFWLRRAGGLPFDPRHDVRTAADLVRFPDVSAEWRTVPVEDLVPAGRAKDAPPPLVFESGGTTGPPKRIVELGFWERSMRWLSDRLDDHGVPGAGNWLYLGPTGPHVAGYLFTTTAAHRGGTCFTVDFDPRWARLCELDGGSRALTTYIHHVLDQAGWTLATQQVAVLWATPPVLEAIAARPRLADLVRMRVQTIIWSGVAASPETLRLLREEIFPDIALIGVYGNTLMGVAPQRPPVPGDEHACVFQPFHPHTLIELVDPRSGSPVPYGARGQVRLHHLSKDLFLPNIAERDLAVRVAPPPAFRGDGLADVRPAAVAGRQVVEGVY
ncbi:phenazine biosynthesis protein [Actinomadura barringtoniae]|uniref:Phenazine biosynthesis protein n=1 Tax=Actinomadura barringtoniae TaxID=1427535 RepID=A0A939TBY8_9ACTN|nr:phenazine biosynthesis protein [Actinomadura barringtoniae]MBO2454012.1 phenazine biosynthesis protein [Actinomadura barringtoniae]